MTVKAFQLRTGLYTVRAARKQFSSGGGDGGRGGSKGGSGCAGGDGGGDGFGDSASVQYMTTFVQDESEVSSATDPARQPPTPLSRCQLRRASASATLLASDRRCGVGSLRALACERSSPVVSAPHSDVVHPGGGGGAGGRGGGGGGRGGGRGSGGGGEGGSGT